MRKLRWGMIGGGQGAFIGDVHRMAARLDGMYDLVAGALSSTAEKSLASGKALGLAESRCYPDYETMLKAEHALPAEERIEVVSIVTPNYMHYAPAALALSLGFHVVCDKPVTLTTEEAIDLKHKQGDNILAVTHNYTGYPMVKQAKTMVAEGVLGEIRRIIVEYPQGWLATKLEDSGQKQAAWRTDPKRSGKAGAMGDIGTHAENLLEYITGLKIKTLLADLNQTIPDRALDDDGSVLLRMENGARGTLIATQIATGEENDLNIRLYGEKGSLRWFQMEPNSLIYRTLDGHQQIIRTGVGDLYPVTQAATRIPSGHPEGFLEAFANIYKAIAQHILSLKDPSVERTLDYPTIDDGIRGMQFIDAVVDSSVQGAVWVTL